MAVICKLFLPSRKTCHRKAVCLARLWKLYSHETTWNNANCHIRYISFLFFLPPCLRVKEFTNRFIDKTYSYLVVVVTMAAGRKSTVYFIVKYFMIKEKKIADLLEILHSLYIYLIEFILIKSYLFFLLSFCFLLIFAQYNY